MLLSSHAAGLSFTGDYTVGRNMGHLLSEKWCLFMPAVRQTWAWRHGMAVASRMHMASVGNLLFPPTMQMPHGGEWELPI